MKILFIVNSIRATKISSTHNFNPNLKKKKFVDPHLNPSTTKKNLRLQGTWPNPIWKARVKKISPEFNENVKK